MNNVNSHIEKCGDDGAHSAVIAITQEHEQLKAVMLQKKDGVFEVVRTASADSAKISLQKFVSEFDDETSSKIVLGYGLEGVIFYHINVPCVKTEELAALVRLQVEARTPLPVDQMEFSWRTGRSDGRQISVTLAAARKQQLQNFVARFGNIEPQKIMLNCEGLVKVWQTAFSDNGRQGLVLDVSEHSTQVCLVEDGYLCSAAMLDMGTNDFSAGQVEIAERFTQDMRSVLELFGFSDPASLPVFVLSNGQAALNEMVSSLGLAGFEVETALPRFAKLSAAGNLSATDIYEYRVALGLAVMALEPVTNELNIFERLYTLQEDKRERWTHSSKLTGAIAAAMFVLLIIVCYAVDAASLKVMEKHFNSSEEKITCSGLLERQKVMKEAALRRPDLLRLFSEMNSDKNNGIMLDGFHFKKGQPVTISGQADSDEKLYKFQENLLSKKSISKVRIQNTKKEKKGKKLNFSMTFHYKNFTKKKSLN